MHLIFSCRHKLLDLIFSSRLRSGREGNETRRTHPATFSILHERRIMTDDPKTIYVLSPELAFIVQKIEATRSECLKALWHYIIENELHCSTNRSFFEPDERLQKIFGTKKVPIFGMSKFLTKHLY